MLVIDLGGTWQGELSPGSPGWFPALKVDRDMGLVHPQCVEERFRRSIISAVIRLRPNVTQITAD